MKFIKQFCIIMLIALVGEILNALIPLPIPAGIYGMVILFVCLKSGLLKVSAVKETGYFFIEIMPIFFVAPGVDILKTIPVLQKYWWQFLVITTVSFVIVFAASGHTTQGLIKFFDERKSEKKRSR